MKKILALILAIAFCVTAFAACGKDEKYEWMNYDFDEYITLADYEDIEIDLESKEYLETLDDYAKSVMDNASLAESVSITDGAIENGDVANINFVGKMDGKAFEGGTANNYDLTIGSGSFIDGFEEGLIGLKVGETKVLKLTFPESYHSAEMAGKAVEFTVTINKITRSVYPEINEDIAKKLGFSNLEDYNKTAKDNCLFAMIREILVEDSKVITLPEKEVEIMVDKAVEYYTAYAKSQNMTFTDFLKANKMDEKEFRATAATDSESSIKEYMIYYAICEEEDLVDDEKYDVYVEKLASLNGLTVDELTSNYDALDIESAVISLAVQDYLVANVAVKNAD